MHDVSKVNKSVIVIDDDVKILLVYSTLLKTKNFESQVFQNFKDCIQYLDSHSPDLIISDMNVNNDINGIEFYLFHVMNKNIKFALHSGTLIPTKNALQSFQEQLPHGFTITGISKKFVGLEQVDIIIEDNVNQKKHTFPFFSKPTMPEEILKYFDLE